MKPIYIALALAIIVSAESCKKESDLFDQLSPEDEFAIEGMEEAFGTAKLYNDSLAWCNGAGISCSPTFIHYCDSIFHSNDESFEMHHNNYSHNNIGDDHHHSATGEHSHGDDEHDDDGGDGHDSHSIDSHNEMNELRAEHELLHP